MTLYDRGSEIEDRWNWPNDNREQVIRLVYFGFEIEGIAILEITY